MAMLLLLIATLVVVVHSVPLNNTPKVEDGSYRLTNDVVPSHYLLHLTLTEETFTTNKFSGNLVLTLVTQADINAIYVHAGEKLHVLSIVLRTQNGAPLTVGSTTYNADTEILTIPIVETVAANETLMLVFDFTADLITDEMYGFYKSDYIDEDGNRQFLATTQFQATYARRAFPCFDEPAFKAVFDIRITHPTRFTAVANTLGTTYPSLDGTASETAFKATPLISTYLVAFIVSEFSCTTGESLTNEIPYRVCSRIGSEDTRDLALVKGPLLIKALEDFTQIDYSVSTIGKMDQYAIPDFAAGAMENWGLVTYRERLLLWDPVESSNRHMQSIETVVAHEFGHMWFGNLITTHWWEDTFLNEGFATFCEYFITGAVEPQWEMENQFVVEQVQTALSSDASASTHPLSKEVSTPDEVSGRFSTVSYNKGGSVLRMVEHFMGAENFKQGVHQYLDANQFGNTNPEDLWEHLNDHAENLPNGLSLNTVMNSWTYKPGYPVVEVNQNGQSVVLSQKRFLLSGDPGTDEKWYVPISYTVSEDTNKFQDTSARGWLTPTNDLTIPNVTSWIIVNNRETGFYRVRYDDTIFARITTALQQTTFSNIHEINRAQLIDDYYNFARVGVHDYERFLNLITFLAADSSYTPWYAAFSAFNNMFIRTEKATIRESLSAHISDLMKILYASVPFETSQSDNQIYSLKRVLAHTWACRLGLDNCIQNAVTAYSAYVANNTTPDKNLKPVIYCYALRHSTSAKTDWDFLWNKYVNTKLATEQVVILAALGCTKDTALLEDYLSKSIDATSGIRQQDALSVFSAVYSHPEGVDVALNFLLDNHEDITNYYASLNSVSNLFSGIANRITKKEQHDKLEEFLKRENLAENVLTAGQSALNVAKSNLEVVADLEGQLDSFFTPEKDDTSAAEAVAVKFYSLFAAAILIVRQLYF